MCRVYEVLKPDYFTNARLAGALTDTNYVVFFLCCVVLLLLRIPLQVLFLIFILSLTPTDE